MNLNWPVAEMAHALRALTALPTAIRHLRNAGVEIRPAHRPKGARDRKRRPDPRVAALDVVAARGCPHCHLTLEGTARAFIRHIRRCSAV